MSISDDETEARLSADGGLIRNKIIKTGHAALWSLVVSNSGISASDMADHVRFMALSWLDKNGDVLDPEAKKSYLRRHAAAELEDLDEK